MKEIEITDESIFEKAEAFSEFRERCKRYLDGLGLNFDKFTVVDHDSYIGYISESVIKEYLKKNIPYRDFEVLSWSDTCNMYEIYNAVYGNDPSMADMVKEYFYDKCDLIVETPTKTVYIDVKTALTKKQPTEQWDFMYPVVQANKEGKDGAILAYCVYEGTDKKHIKKVIVAGYIENKTVKKCRIIRKGQRTKFNTISQTDNYETYLWRDYKSLEDLINEILAE